jgi:hypothetical protein
MLGTIIPAILGWVIAKRRRSYLNKYMKTIVTAYEVSHKNKEESLESLGKIRNEIADLFNKGKISEEHYGLLDNKISEYMDKVSKE